MTAKLEEQPATIRDAVATLTGLLGLSRFRTSARWVLMLRQLLLALARLVGCGLDVAGIIHPGFSKTEGIRLWLVQNAGMIENWLAQTTSYMLTCLSASPPMMQSEVLNCCGPLGWTAAAVSSSKESDLQLMGQDLKMPSIIGSAPCGPSRFECSHCGNIFIGEYVVEAHMTESCSAIPNGW